VYRFTLAVLAVVAALLSPCAARPAADDVISEVPFTYEKGHIIVQAKIQGDKPVEVALATGLEHSAINVSLLQKYKLQSGYTGDGVITGSSLDKIYVFATVSDIRVGDLKLTGMSLRFDSPASSVSARVGREIFAVFGADFFKGRVAQFDFEKRVVRFLRRAPADPPKEGGGAHAERAVLRMEYKEPVMMPIVENVTFDGKKVKTLFDTGALTVVSLTPSGAKQLGLTTPREKGEPVTAKVGSLRIGGIEFSDVPAAVHAKGSKLDRDAEGYGAVAGVALLQNFLATFDFRDYNVILERR
jgi:hypothetical protein